jgi:cobalt/nickel transport system permease protein
MIKQGPSSLRKQGSRYFPMSVVFASVLFSLIFAASAAHAMHLKDGTLPLSWSLLWFAVSAPFIAMGLRRISQLARDDHSIKPLVGLLAAVVFIISCMPIPIPTLGTSSHPCGVGISAVLLGPALSMIIATVALLIQSLFLSHGGLTTLGANAVAMGVAGSWGAFLIFKGLRSVRVSLGMAAFAAGVFADWATYLATSGILASGIRGNQPFLPLFLKVVVAFVPTQLPIGILEGAITAGVVTLLYRKRPELLMRLGVLTSADDTVEGQKVKV